MALPPSFYNGRKDFTLASLPDPYKIVDNAEPFDWIESTVYDKRISKETFLEDCLVDLPSAGTPLGTDFNPDPQSLVEQYPLLFERFWRKDMTHIRHCR